MHRWCLLNLTVQGFSLNLTVRGVSNKHCLLTFFILSYDIKITLKSHFWRNKSLCAQHCYGLHSIHVMLPKNL